MSRRSRFLLVILSIALMLSIFAVSAFADTGVRLPVQKNIPSATAVIQRSGGITQTPNGFAGNPYGNPNDFTYLYSGGNADSSVKLVVYSDNGYSDSSGIWTGVKSLHYVFTSRSVFDFNIDFGNVPIQLYDEFLPDDLSNVSLPTAMAVSVRSGLAEGLNSQGLPSALRDVENISTEVFLNTYSSLGSYYSSLLDFSSVGYTHLGYDYDNVGAMTAVNSIAGTVDFDVGNYYNFVDVRICIQADYDEYGFFIPGITSCDELNTRYLSALSTYSAGNGYDIGYFDGKNDGLSEGYDTGYDVGYGAGFDVGYNDGSAEAIDNMGMFSVFTKSIDALMDFPLFDLPNGDTISLGLLLGVIVGAMAFVWLLKLIAGG